MDNNHCQLTVEKKQCAAHLSGLIADSLQGCKSQVTLVGELGEAADYAERKTNKQNKSHEYLHLLI